MQRRAYWSAFVGFLWLLCAPVAQAAEEITIGFTVALTGSFADLGQQQLQGTQMWATDINARGALLGRPVKLVYYDDESDPEKSGQLYERLINEDKVDLLLGPYSSDITLAASAVAERHGFPMLAVGAAADQIWERGYENIFGIDIPAKEYMRSVLELLKPHAPLRVALVYYDEATFTQNMADGVRQKASAFGLDIVFDEGAPDIADIPGLVERIRRTDADVVIGVTYFNGSVAFLQESRKQGLEPKLFVFSVGPALREFGDTLGTDAEGVMGPVPWIRSEHSPFAYDFSYRYKERFGDNAVYHATYGYAAGEVLEAAVRLAGSLDKDKVREQLASMNFRSLLGIYRVDETGKQVGHRTFVMQWQDGRRRLVSPPELAESPARFPATR